MARRAKGRNPRIRAAREPPETSEGDPSLAELIARLSVTGFTDKNPSWARPAHDIDVFRALSRELGGRFLTAQGSISITREEYGTLKLALCLAAECAEHQMVLSVLLDRIDRALTALDDQGLSQGQRLRLFRSRMLGNRAPRTVRGPSYDVGEILATYQLLTSKSEWAARDPKWKLRCPSVRPRSAIADFWRWWWATQSYDDLGLAPRRGAGPSDCVTLPLTRLAAVMVVYRTFGFQSAEACVKFLGRHGVRKLPALRNR